MGQHVGQVPAEIGSVVQMMELRHLQRLDFHLAEYHHALVVREAF
jgi:hypothetical protein